MCCHVWKSDVYCVKVKRDKLPLILGIDSICKTTKLGLVEVGEEDIARLLDNDLSYWCWLNYSFLQNEKFKGKRQLPQTCLDIKLIPFWVPFHGSRTTEIEDMRHFSVGSFLKPTPLDQPSVHIPFEHSTSPQLIFVEGFSPHLSRHLKPQQSFSFCCC